MPTVQVRRLRLPLPCSFYLVVFLLLALRTSPLGREAGCWPGLASLSATQLRRFKFLDFLISIRGVEALEVVWGGCGLITLKVGVEQAADFLVV